MSVLDRFEWGGDAFDTAKYTRFRHPTLGTGNAYRTDNGGYLFGVKPIPPTPNGLCIILDHHSPIEKGQDMITDPLIAHAVLAVSEPYGAQEWAHATSEPLVMMCVCTSIVFFASILPEPLLGVTPTPWHSFYGVMVAFGVGAVWSILRPVRLVKP